MIKKIPSRDFLDVVGNVQEMLRQLMTISRLIFYSNYGKIRERFFECSKRLIIHFMVDRNSMNQSLKIYWYYIPSCTYYIHVLLF